MWIELSYIKNLEYHRVLHSLRWMSGGDSKSFNFFEELSHLPPFTLSVEREMCILPLID